MTVKQLTQEYAFDLYSDADHLAKLAAEARQAIEHDRIDRAESILMQAERPLALLAMRLRDVRGAVDRLKADAS